MITLAEIDRLMDLGAEVRESNARDIDEILAGHDPGPGAAISTFNFYFHVMRPMVEVSRTATMITSEQTFVWNTEALDEDPSLLAELRARGFSA